MNISSADSQSIAQDNNELAALMLQRFTSREDCVGQANSMSTPVTGRAEIVTRLQKHLSGECRLGLYDLLPDASAQWAVVEFEDHTEDPSAADPCLVDALRYQQKLAELSVPSLLERSKNLNGRCYHLHIRFDKPLSARLIRDRLRTVGREFFGTFRNEIFPKGENGIGNFVWLPLFGGANDVIRSRSGGERRGGGVPSGRTVFLDTHGTVFSDQRAALEAWPAASTHSFAQDALPVTDSASNLLNLSPNGTGIEVSQPGLEKMEANCPICRQWVANPVGWHYDHWLGLASNYAVFKGGRERFIELSRKDAANFSPAEIDRIWAEVLGFHGPQTYDKFREQGLDFELPANAPKAPASWRRHVDTETLMNRILAAKGEVREDLVRQCFCDAFPLLSAGKQDVLLADLTKRAEIPAADLRSMAREALKSSALVGRNLRDLIPRLRFFGASPEDLGEVIYRWFIDHGGKCYRDKDHVCYLIWNDRDYEIGPNQAYHSLLWSVARMTHEGTESHRVMAAIKAEADLRAKVVEFFTWLYTDTVNHVLYIHQNRDDAQLVRVDRAGVRSVPNGMNEHEVILTPITKMTPVDLVRLDAPAYQQAWQEFDRLVLRNMAAARTDQLMAACWAVCIPLLDYVLSCPHLRFEGGTKRGKSRAMDLIGHFIYGSQQYSSSATIASIYSSAALNPLWMHDNIETKDMTSDLSHLYLTMVTGGQREKRNTATAHGVIIERTHCALCTTGIENLNLPEQINRTLAIPVDHYEYPSSGWSDRMYQAIKAKRPEMFTAHMLLVSRLLNRIAAGEMEARVDWIEQHYPQGHDKDRVNSFLALMALAAEELFPIIAPGMTVDLALTTWIDEQNVAGLETARESSPIIAYLNALRKEAKRHHLRNSGCVLDAGWPYAVDGRKIGNHYELTGTAADLLRAFGQIAKGGNATSPYKNAQQLARRLSEAIDLLKDRGIAITKQLNNENTLVYTVIYPDEETFTGQTVQNNNADESGDEREDEIGF